MNRRNLLVVLAWGTGALAAPLVAFAQRQPGRFHGWRCCSPPVRKDFACRAALVLSAALGALAAPFPASAQQAAPAPRVAVVLSAASPEGSVRLAAFLEGLRELGYVDGQNIRVEARGWAGEARPLAELAGEVARTSPAVIVAEGNSTMAALKQATWTVPIVMSVVGDPVGSGFVASLGRPGANITGLSNTAEQLSGKRLQLLKELLPALERVAVLRNPGNRTHAIFLRETQTAALTLGASLAPFDFAAESDLEPAFRAMVRGRFQAAVVLPQPLGVILRESIAELALRHRVPVMFPSSEAVEVGGLVSYGPSHTDLWRRAARYVDLILKGSDPSDLPIEQPVKFELVINMKTAKALGLRIPRAILLRAERLIE